jgi:glycosyltransferase involved in cell wall biosynthesis
MSIKGARALEQRALVYIMDTCVPGSQAHAGLAVMHGMHGEGVATFLIAPVTPEQVIDQRIQCTEIFSIPELQPHASGVMRLYARVIAFLKVCRVLHDVMSQYPDSIVHTHGTVAGFIGRWAAWCVGVEHSVHTVYTFACAPGMKAYHWWLAYIAEYCTSWITSEYICVRTSDRAYGAQLFPFFHARSTVIRPAVDWQQFYVPEPIKTHERLVSNPIVVGMVLDASAPDQEQTLYTFLRVMKGLYDKGVPVRGEIVGDGAWRWYATRWLLEAGVPDIVRVLGWQAHTAAVIGTWHVFVQCSLFEAMPVSVIKARLSWVPVVAYASSGVDEIIVSEKNGLLVAVADEAALCAAVYRVLIDRPLYERLTTHQESMNEFNEAVVCLRHWRLYKGIASE